jgi:hypothetical protein
MARDGGRDVVVPLRLYKTVTVVSTLLAVAGVVAGFMLLDMATNAGRAAVADINGPLALLGLLSILGGAGVFAYGSRFRAPGMGKAKDDTDEPSGDG